jgi:intracellular multiplication protein IcmO
MANPRLRGLEAHEELSGKDLIRDTRPLWKQAFAVLNTQPAYLTILIILIASLWVKPALAYVSLFSGIIIAAIRYFSYSKDRLPFRLPTRANRIDYSDPIPGRKGFFHSGGTFFLGNESKTAQELWLKSKDILTHMLIFGTTGSGKTEALVSLAFNAIAMGSGFFYIDPKAAPKLAVQIYILARFCGRDDDFRVLNYSTAGKTSRAEHPKTLSNTNNPFAFGTPEGLTQLIVSLIPQADGDNAIFGQNAQTLISSLMYALVEMRDRGEIELSIETVRKFMTLQEYEGLARRTDFSEAALGALKSFLTSVGWQEDRTFDKQPKSLTEQYSYARSYFSLSLASLTDTYGHIYRVTAGEVDMYDIIKNRRILVTMLPALEKSPQELSNLGKIALSAVKNAIAVGLGDKIEGTVADVLESLPTDGPTPFVVITDEYAAIPTPGYVEVLTQGRGQGIVAIVASQDYAGIKGADEIGAQQIIANTKIKLAMKLEDPQTTWELFNMLAGESSVMQTGGYEINDDQSLSISYKDQRSASVSSFGRIHMRDLQEQIEGEFHAFFNGEVIRGRTFYANPPLPSDAQARINQMIAIPLPEINDLMLRLEQTQKTVSVLTQIVEQKNQPSTPKISRGAKRLCEVFKDPKRLDVTDVAISAFLNWRAGEQKDIAAFNQEVLLCKQAQSTNIPKEEDTIKPVSLENSLLPDFAIEELKKIENPTSQEDSREEEEPILNKERKSLYSGFQKMAENGLSLFNCPNEQVTTFQNEIEEIELLCGASVSEAKQYSQGFALDLYERTKIEYPQDPKPQKCLDEKERDNVADFTKSLIAELQNK